MANRRILITGGAGFVGVHLARHLTDNGDEVVLLDDFSRGRDDDELAELTARDSVTTVTGDITDASLYDRLGKGFDQVYHLAAVIGVRHVMERPHDVVRVNAIGTLNLLDWWAAGGADAFLFASTSEAYAWTKQVMDIPTPTPEDVPLALTDIKNPRSSYAGSKIFGELAVTQYGEQYKKPYAIVRFHNVYGPRMGWDHVIPELHERARAGENPLTVYSADHSRAFCYIDDAIEGLTGAIDRGHGGTFNIGNDDEEITMGDLAKRLLKAADIDATIKAVEAKHDPIKRRCPDVARARTELGYAPKVNLDEGLKRTIAWYDNHPRPA